MQTNKNNSIARAWVASMACTALLAACGGGGGTTSAAAPAPSPAAAPAASPAASPPASPSVVTLTAQVAEATLTAADCPRLQSDAQAVAALDLTNPVVKAVNDELLAIDPAHAYKIFSRLPRTYINWMVNTSGGMNLLSNGVAVHETMHEIDRALELCEPNAADRVAKHFLLGTELRTDLRFGDTVNYSVAGETMPASMKTASRYQVYVAAAGASSGNDFRVMLDELAAYTGGAYTERLYIGAKGGTDIIDANLGGMVDFMVFTQNYLMATRLNYPATYTRIKNSPATVAVIRALWSRAESVLRDSYAQTLATSLPRQTYNSAYFAAAYSASLLAELDLIGVTHATAADWSATYLKP